MLVSVQSATRQNIVALPEVVGGAHWIVDASGERLAYVEGSDALWNIEPVAGFSVRSSSAGSSGSSGSADSSGYSGSAGSPAASAGAQSGAPGDSAAAALAIDPRTFAVVNLDGYRGGTWCLIFQPSTKSALETATYRFEGDVLLTVGRAPDNSIIYHNGFVSSHHVNLLFRSGTWSIGDPGSTNGVFLNGRRIPVGRKVSASYGDVVSLLGFRMALGDGLISCNNPADSVAVSHDGLVRYRHRAQPAGKAATAEHAPAPDRSYFYPALRFARAIDKKAFAIDAPPAPEKEETASLLQRIGPSMLMGFASLASACVFISMIAGQGSSMLRAIPLVFMAVSMLAASVIWPVFNARHQRAEREKREMVRRGAYAQYLSAMLSEIAREEQLQRTILSENRLSVRDCLDMAARGDAHLMDRTALHADFLEVRIGLGDEPLEADIKFPDQHFTVEDDELRKEVDAQARKPRVLNGVPLAFPLIAKHVAGVIGDERETSAFVRGVIVQIAALCSYEDVKIVLLTDERQRAEWAFAKHLPHNFTDDRAMRFFACGPEEAAEVGMYLERVTAERAAERASQGNADGREIHPYYVVICASEAIASTSSAVAAIAAESRNVGMSLIAVARAMSDLPKECRSVIGLNGPTGYLLDRDDPAGERRMFAPDIAVAREQAEQFAFNLSKLRLDLSVERRAMPARLGFLEMYGAGNVDHFNIASRWRENSASVSLACPVGVDASGEPFLLNLHEKDHGPHGLIAGTTGSGKSEFIITYILFMALTYSPDDVAFVLIDYKGGGLARAFDNEHVRLPHLAGVITNLDGAAITRSLVSIQSELKRRQALFNRARDVVGGDNVDIYDYLDLYRQGRMSEPCPHLFIVADEFAELKQQEPDFMDELISAARIGRSLGVHLVLATQKPSGVVNDQIWSNARFKVCLKVADAGDSKEMIRRPDAAELQEAGRFYLLVGYNEYFALGQSAYSGARYTPRERYMPARDDAVVLISDTGRPLVSVKPPQEGGAGDGRPESVAVLSAIEHAAEALDLQARQLWLEPIPAHIELNALLAGGAGSIEPAGLSASASTEAPAVDSAAASTLPALDPVVGKYDDPARQRQGLLTLQLEETGNAIAYGTSDSGVELVLHAAAYALLGANDATALHMYMLDFGSETLRAFAPAPQVGSVIGVADDEQVGRFFSFFDKEFARRRDLLAEYGGSFARYARVHGDLPAIVVLLNDIGAFLEAYPQHEDRLARFLHETGRNGVRVIATAAGVTSVRVKMRQSFRQVLAVNLADATDYSLLFGPLHDLAIPKGFGRGLVQLDDGVYEFQAAHLTGSAGGDEYGFAASFSEGLWKDAEASAESVASDGGKRGDAAASGVSGAFGAAGIPGAAPFPVAPPIPSAPRELSPDQVAAFEASAEFIPYGIFHDTLEPAGFDFSDSPIARVQFQRGKDGAAFARAFLASMAPRGDWDAAVLDMAQLLGSAPGDGPDGAPGGGSDSASGSSSLAGCVFATTGDEAAKSFLQESVLARRASDSGDTRLLLVLTGVADFITRSGFDFGATLKAFLQNIPATAGVNVLLLDAAAGSSYTFEDWFKANLTSKDGLWVGPGIEAQTAIGITYGSTRLLPDSDMDATRAYAIAGGQPRLVRLPASQR